MKKELVKKWGFRFAFFVLFCVFLYALFQVVFLEYQEKKEESAFSNIQTEVKKILQGQEIDFAEIDDKKKKKSTSVVVKIPCKMSDDRRVQVMDTLRKKNSDFYGWLSIPDTPIDYPVMFTPEDEQYYLHRSFEKQYSFSGVPFLARECGAGCNSLLMYGHHMKNGTMFASLLNYQSEEYTKKHPYIILDTLDSEQIYEVVVSFSTQADSKKFDYTAYAGKNTKTQRKEYLDLIWKFSGKRLEGITQEDHLLTLSTCSYHIADGRYVVIAKKIQG